MAKKLSKPSMRKFSKDDKPDKSSRRNQIRDEEQGWIAPATTFETEDTMSPRSFESLTTSDLLIQNRAKVEEGATKLSILDPSQQNHSDQFLDLEDPVKENARTSMVFLTKSDLENRCHNIEYNGKVPKTYKIQNAAPQIRFEDRKNIQGIEKKNNDQNAALQMGLEDPKNKQGIEKQNIDQASTYGHTRDSMISLLLKIDTSEVIEEDNEIGSLVPIADLSFFLDDDVIDDDFHCVGRLSTRPNEGPPIEIDIDSDSFVDATKIPQLEEKVDEMHVDDDDEVSSTSSYNSYLQAIESITASANRRVEQAMTIAMDIMEKNSFEQERHKSCDQTIPMEINNMYTRMSPPAQLEVQHEQDPESDDEEDRFRVSFNPSNEMLLIAMKGASVQARMDIERATALALSKIDSAKSKEISDMARAVAKNTPNRVLGLIIIFFFFFNMFQFLAETQLTSNSKTTQSSFQLQSYNDTDLYRPADLSTWEEKQTVMKSENNTHVVLNDEHVYNVGCAFKIGCLALGNI